MHRELGGAEHVDLALARRQDQRRRTGIADDELDVPAEEFGAPDQHLRPGAAAVDDTGDHRLLRLVGQVGEDRLARHDDRPAAVDAADIGEFRRIELDDFLAQIVGIHIGRGAAHPERPVGLDHVGEIVRRLDAVTRRHVAIEHPGLARQVLLEVAADEPGGAVGPAARRGTDDDVDPLVLEIRLRHGAVGGAGPSQDGGGAKHDGLGAEMLHRSVSHNLPRVCRPGL